MAPTPTPSPTRRFVATTLAGGLLFLIPVVVISLIVERALQVVGKVAHPLVEALGLHTILGFGAAGIVAILLLVGVCFVAGIVAKTDRGRGLTSWAEGTILDRIPGYAFLKQTTQDFAGLQRDTALRPGLARFDDVTQLCFIVEPSGAGHTVVFLPDAPTPWSGTVAVMTNDRITPLDIPMRQAIEILKRLGHGAGPWLSERL